MEEKRLNGQILSEAEWEVVRVRMEGAVGLLPEVARRVYLLSARDGYSCDEIAKRLGIEVVEVSRQLAIALVEVDRAVNPC